MARYIDEKDVYALVEPTGIARVHCSQIDELPRADVAPRAEVEKLREINNCLLEAGQEWQKRYESLAREIFSEIDDILQTVTVEYGAHSEDFEGIDYEAYAELKKKYTEG